MSSSSSSKKITLKSSDDITFEVDEAVALQSQTIKQIIADNGGDGGVVRVPTVKGSILGMVIDYCKKHVDVEVDHGRWDAEFMRILDGNTLCHLVTAAYDIKVQSLVDLTSQRIADMIKGLPPHEIRKCFNIKSDHLTPEQKEQIRENRWAFG
ncbi:hypothetical protein Tsubulata_039898 [Turnera subulata]|uniref:SKP1-like protein n=1 Tax=Turnera subulata TaxID=218843 RepID=A0A9Q0FQA4_9ROSI|nr:hypothetical protein Tsubulata_039898 [Turnera subulata]